jgi:hypothetical protein
MVLDQGEEPKSVKILFRKIEEDSIKQLRAAYYRACFLVAKRILFGLRPPTCLASSSLWKVGSPVPPNRFFYGTLASNWHYA